MNRRNLLACLFISSAIILLAWSLSSRAAVAGPPAQTGQGPEGTYGIYRGLLPVERFDISPPLRDITPVQLDRKDLLEIPERPTGLEGPYGPQDADAAIQISRGPNLIPTPIVSFDGPANSDNSPMVTPPDPVGDVGPDHYVAMSNLVFEIFDKNGTSLLGPANNNTLWAGFGGACETENSGDPIVIYDQLDDRWILTQFTSAGPTYYNCVAVSTSGDPTSTYYRYAFSTGTNFPDYPKYGVWPDALYISTREFAGASYAGVGAYAVNRAQLIAGNPSPTVISFLVPPGATPYNIGDGLLPSDMDGTTLPPPNSPNYFVGSMDNGGPYGAPQDALTLWKFTADFGTPANSTFTLANTIPVAAFDSIFPCSPGSRDCIPQPGTTNKVDILSYRQRPLWRLAYRNFGTHESLVTNQAVEAAANIAGVRWYEIRSPNSSPLIYQQGTYAPGVSDGIHRWMGSIAMDQEGNMALGYSASDGTSTYPSSWYTGRLAGDPLGTMPQGEGSIITGTGSQTGSQRWGDYTSMNIDPVDDCTFWYVNQYLPVTSSVGWVLRIGAFKFDACGTPDFTLAADPTTQGVCIPANAVYDITVGQVQSFTDPVTLSTAGAPTGTTSSFSPNSLSPPYTSTLTIGNTGAAAPGSYTLDIVGVAPTSTHTVTVGLDLVNTVPGVPTLLTPANGGANVPQTPSFTWSGTASSYTIEIATDPAFNNVVHSAVVSGPAYSGAALATATRYYWRVTPANACGSGAVSATWSFTTEPAPGQCSPGSIPNVLYSTDFESGDAGWSHGGSGDTWALSMANPHSGSWAYHADNPSTVSDQQLVSPAVALPTGQAPLSLQFWNYQHLEDRTGGCYDGGILEISDNGGGTWSQVLGPDLLTDPYDGPISASFFNPLGGLDAWCGDPQLYLNSIVDLSAYAGATVQFRFRLGTDSSISRPGWDIDDVVVQACTPVAEIEVAPPSLESTQPVDVQVTHPMTITNNGLAALDWNIFEDNGPTAAATFNLASPVPGLALGLPASNSQAARSPATPDTVLYDQTDNVGSNGAPSQVFPDFGNDYLYAADDFTVPAGGWTITGTLALGQYTVGPAPVWDVYIYADAGGMPGSLIYSYADLVATSDVSGDVTLAFPSPAALRAGTYWLSVVADMEFSSGGQWFWNTRAVQTGNPYHWTENGLLSTPCVGIWGPGASVCGVGGGVDPDLLFALYGSPGGTCLLPEADIPWASVDPITGTTPAGLSTALAVTFDSTGLSTGVHTGTLCVASNAYTDPLVPVPLTLTVATYGVALSPDQAQTGLVGTTVTYTVQITNTGTAADIFDLAPSGQAWATTLSQGAIALDPGQSGGFTVQVAVPAGAANNDSDTATITATSRGDPTASAATTVTTTATGQEYLLYLPIIPRLQ